MYSVQFVCMQTVCHRGGIASTRLVFILLMCNAISGPFEQTVFLKPKYIRRHKIKASCDMDKDQ